MCLYEQLVTIPEKDCHIIGSTKITGNTRNGLKHWLKIELRTADDS